MTGITSSKHRMIEATAWDPEQPAEYLTPHILRSRSSASSYVVTSDDGDVVINAGTLYQGERHRERFEELLGRPLDVRKIILTQSHNSHMGGWAAFTGPGTETIAHRKFTDGRLDWTVLKDFAARRMTRLFDVSIGAENIRRRWNETPEPVLTTVFSESHAFEVGGRRFELYSVPGGEITDGIAVWLPAERTVFIGNLFGALYGMLPHLSTIRGDHLRSARLFVSSVDRILDLEPERLITGHHPPVEGAQQIREDLVHIRDATQYIHDETVKGMNDGKDLWTLMAEIELPAELEPAPQGRGPVRWYVRAVWEEYVGWFRAESTTELYAVPPRAIWGELAELAGGPSVLAARAAAHVAAGEPVEALHFTDIALSIDPDHREAREAQIAALEILLERTGGDPWDEIRWLEGEIERARESYARSAGGAHAVNSV